MSADYFTVAEYRAWALNGATPYTDAEIDQAQEEVVDRLEAWARTSWMVREAVEYFDLGRRGYVLANVPILSVDGLDLDGEPVGIGDYVPGLSEGVVWYDTSAFQRDTIAEHQSVKVTYTFGFGTGEDDYEVPRAVKRPAMAAVATLLPHVAEQKAGNIPQNVTEYRTEGATFVITPGDDAEPWPWDGIASRDIRNYWGPRRPRGVGSI